MSLPSRSNVRRPTARLPGMLAAGVALVTAELVIANPSQESAQEADPANPLASYPLAVLDGRPALVAVGMNGEPLPVRHGFRCGWSLPAATDACPTPSGCRRSNSRPSTPTGRDAAGPAMGRS